MADFDSHESSDYDGDEEDNDQFLVQYFRKSPENELFRPTLADECKIGFFSLDRACQTEESEIIDLKEMTKVIQQLSEDAAGMKRDINFARHVMEADFEAKLQQKSIDLYCRVNEQIGEIEKLHEERVATVRRAFKQQLSDGIARMHTYYNKMRMADVAEQSKYFAQKLAVELEEQEQNQDIQARLNQEQKRKDAGSNKFEQRMKEMTATIQRNESVIVMLRAQLAQYQKEAEQKELEENMEEEEPEPEEIRAPSRTESVVAEIDGLKDEISDLETKVHKMEKTVNQKDSNINDLNNQIQSLNEQLEREKIMVQQMQHEKEELASSAEQDKASSKRLLDNQRLQLQREMEEKLKKAKEEVLNSAKVEAQALQDAERDKLRQMAEEKKKIEQQLAQERAKANEKSQEAVDLERAQKNEVRLVNEITKLKVEIEKVHKSWEKKFAILQQSLHALKDESYLRQTMQRQAAQLHQASVSYAYDQPMGIQPTKAPPPPPPPAKKPLPNIGKNAKNAKNLPQDYISYTVSARSGRATTIMSADENQVMSGDEQDLPPGILPLPSPPPRMAANNCASEENIADNSRPSTRQHVVVLPSVEAL